MHYKNRQIGLLDWDGTLRQGYTLFDWVHLLNNNGVLSTSVHKLLLNELNDYQTGELSYFELVSRTANIYAKSMSGINQSELRNAAEKFTQNDNSIFPFTKKLINYLHNKGIKVVIVSGAPSIVLDAFAERLEIDEVFGLDLEINTSGHYVGSVSINHGLYEEKMRIVNNILQNNGIIVLGVGNAKSDLPLLENASHSFILEKLDELMYSDNIHVSSPDNVFNDIKQSMEVNHHD